MYIRIFLNSFSRYTLKNNDIIFSEINNDDIIKGERKKMIEGYTNNSPKLNMFLLRNWKRKLSPIYNISVEDYGPLFFIRDRIKRFLRNTVDINGSTTIWASSASNKLLVLLADITRIRANRNKSISASLCMMTTL